MPRVPRLRGILSFENVWECVCMGVVRHARFTRRKCWALLAIGAVSLISSGCGSSASAPLPDVESRMAELFHWYHAYVQKNQKGPPNEEALKEFGKKLTSEERANYRIGNDLESIWVSPRDNKKFEVNYNVKIDPSQNRLVIWESTSQNGIRYVALTFGYVVAQDDETFKGQKK